MITNYVFYDWKWVLVHNYNYCSKPTLFCSEICHYQYQVLPHSTNFTGKFILLPYVGPTFSSRELKNNKIERFKVSSGFWMLVYVSVYCCRVYRRFCPKSVTYWLTEPKNVTCPIQFNVRWIFTSLDATEIRNLLIQSRHSSREKN